ncbi:hypothetical protein JOE09_003083 [Pantoea coffeiphila]|nr:hypothetical protein [Pantoea coffeiphila]
MLKVEMNKYRHNTTKGVFDSLRKSGELNVRLRLHLANSTSSRKRITAAFSATIINHRRPIDTTQPGC